ncbi:hypothetical protein [Mesonia sp. HuA40]|uniref:hypothetical protein n=1 Tax=Mesonia sp. HuA40 TaxID=2602761 RepID=UPI0011C8160A|nr:hypothetical protein [Mesonia sp. HuA40]TXK75291.1 hypothetical protein FT993_00795 [Mesonia sp. HuA40]
MQNTLKYVLLFLGVTIIILASYKLIFEFQPVYNNQPFTEQPLPQNMAMLFTGLLLLLAGFSFRKRK